MNPFSLRSQKLDLAELSATEQHLVETVDRACRLAKNGTEITAVHVVPGRRPTYREISNYRLIAEENEIDLRIDAFGAVTIRKAEESTDVELVEIESGPSKLATAAQFVTTHAPTVLAVLAAGICTWSAGFSGLSEGLR